MAIYYHATFEENIPSILEKGLLPFFGGVYLTDSIQAACNWKWISAIATGRDKIAVIAVDVDESKLEPGKTHAPIMEQMSGGKSLVHREGVSPDKIVDVMVMTPTEANPKRITDEEMKIRYIGFFDAEHQGGSLKRSLSKKGVKNNYLRSIRKGKSITPKYQRDAADNNEFLVLHRWGKWPEDARNWRTLDNLDKWVFERKIEWPTKQSARLFATTFLDEMQTEHGENHLFYDTSNDKISWFFSSEDLGKGTSQFSEPDGYIRIRRALNTAMLAGISADDITVNENQVNALEQNIRKKKGTLAISNKDVPNFLKTAKVIEFHQDSNGDEYIGFIINVEGDYKKGYMDYRPRVNSDDLITVLALNRNKIIRQVDFKDTDYYLYEGQTNQQAIDSGMVRIAAFPSGKVFGVIKKHKFEDGYEGLALILEWEITTNNAGKKLGFGQGERDIFDKRQVYELMDKSTYSSRYNRTMAAMKKSRRDSTSGQKPSNRYKDLRKRNDDSEEEYLIKISKAAGFSSPHYLKPWWNKAFTATNKEVRGYDLAALATADNNLTDILRNARIFNELPKRWNWDGRSFEDNPKWYEAMGVSEDRDILVWKSGDGLTKTSIDQPDNKRRFAGLAGYIKRAYDSEHLFPWVMKLESLGYPKITMKELTSALKNKDKSKADVSDFKKYGFNKELGAPVFKLLWSPMAFEKVLNILDETDSNARLWVSLNEPRKVKHDTWLGKPTFEVTLFDTIENKFGFNETYAWNAIDDAIKSNELSVSTVKNPLRRNIRTKRPFKAAKVSNAWPLPGGEPKPKGSKAQHGRIFAYFEYKRQKVRMRIDRTQWLIEDEYGATLKWSKRKADMFVRDISSILPHEFDMRYEVDSFGTPYDVSCKAGWRTSNAWVNQMLYDPNSDAKMHVMRISITGQMVGMSPVGIMNSKWLDSWLHTSTPGRRLAKQWNIKNPDSRRNPMTSQTSYRRNIRKKTASAISSMPTWFDDYEIQRYDYKNYPMIEREPRLFLLSTKETEPEFGYNGRARTQPNVIEIGIGYGRGLGEIPWHNLKGDDKISMVIKPGGYWKNYREWNSSSNDYEAENALKTQSWGYGDFVYVNPREWFEKATGLNLMDEEKAGRLKWRWIEEDEYKGGYDHKWKHEKQHSVAKNISITFEGPMNKALDGIMSKLNARYEADNPNAEKMVTEYRPTTYDKTRKQWIFTDELEATTNPTRRNIRKKSTNLHIKSWWEDDLISISWNLRPKWTRGGKPTARITISPADIYGNIRDRHDVIGSIAFNPKTNAWVISLGVSTHGWFHNEYATWLIEKGFVKNGKDAHEHFYTKTLSDEDFVLKLKDIRFGVAAPDDDETDFEYENMRRNIRRKTVEEKDLFSIEAFSEPRILPSGYDWEAKTTYDITSCGIMPDKAGKTMLLIQVTNQEARQTHAFADWGLTTPTRKAGVGMQKVETTWEFAIDTEFRVKRKRKRGKGPDVDATKMTGDKWKEIVKCLKNKPNFPPSLMLAMEKAIDTKLASDPNLSWRRWKRLEFSVEHEEAMLNNGWEKFVKKYGFPLRRN